MTENPNRPAPQPEEPAAPATAARVAANLADGQWHRLHPATPLLRGGIAFLAILGIVISNLRQRLVDLFLPTPGYGPNSDPVDAIYTSGMAGWVLLAIAVILILCIGVFYLAWRMHSFRIGDDAVEVRSGMLFRTHRKARLDRIQGINLSRSLFARIFGAAKLEISVAGQDANVQLAYLGSKLADALRREILHLASGTRAESSQHTMSAAAPVIPPFSASPYSGSAYSAGPVPGPVADTAETRAPAPDRRDAPLAPRAHPEFATRMSAVLSDRVDEFMAPELDPDAAPPESIVKIPLGRLIGSIVLSGGTALLVLMGLVLIAGAVTGRPWLLFVLLPGILGSAGFYSRRITRSLQYSIAGTNDGVRIGFGLLSTSNETLPPGRIHAVEVTQPIFWRPFGWWQIRVDTAGHSKEKGAAGQANTTILPVGDLADVTRVLGLVLPAFATEEHRDLIEEGMSSGGARYVTAPSRAAWLRPLSWRRTGYTVTDGAALLRHGVIWRRLIMVPLARLQSVGVEQGPVLRMLRLARAELHTVAGPVRPRLAVVDRDQALVLFEEVAGGAVDWGRRDTTQRWNAGPEDSATDP